VLVRIAIEPTLRPAELELPDGTIRREQFQVAVHRTEADPGQPTPRYLMQLRGGWMSGQFPKLLQHNLSLSRVSAAFLIVHAVVS
jgi:hypothetical protein